VVSADGFAEGFEIVGALVVGAAVKTDVGKGVGSTDGSDDTDGNNEVPCTDGAPVDVVGSRVDSETGLTVGIAVGEACTADG
jgi:hypothetical protein